MTMSLGVTATAPGVRSTTRICSTRPTPPSTAPSAGSQQGSHGTDRGTCSAGTRDGLIAVQRGSARETSCSWPESVWLVAFTICTCVSSPGSATR